MERKYEAFVEELRQQLLDATGLTEDRIYFEKEGGKYAVTGDRLVIACAQKGETQQFCGLYVEELFERYKENTPMDTLVEEVLRDVDKALSLEFLEKTKDMLDYEKVKKDLFVRLLNVDKHAQSLTHAVFRTVGDIALVLYMKIGEHDGYTTSMKIRREYVQYWGEDEGKVLKEALYNTLVTAPPRIFRWERLIFEPDYPGESFMDPALGFKVKRNALGNCLSTSRRTNGAVAIFMPGVARRLAALMGEDLYLVFTSVHEVMIHNDKAVCPEDLKGVLCDTISAATPKEDYLTSSIYHYCSETDTISRVCL